MCSTGLPVSADEAGDDRLQVTTDRLQLVFSLNGASPVLWRACYPSCQVAGVASGKSVRFTSYEDPPQARLILRGPGSRLDLERLRFTADFTEDGRAQILTFQSELPVDGVRVVKSFEVSKQGYEVVMTVRLLGPNAAAFAADRRLELEFSAGYGLFPAPAAGFSAILDGVRRVTIADGDVRVLGDDSRGPTPLRAGDWVGFRSRFWTVLVRSDDAVTLDPRPGASLALVLAREPEALSSRYIFYSGPVEHSSLTRTDPELGRMLFSGLWFWLRALSLALLFLLRGLTAIVGHPGPSIVALAVTVKILLLPLTAVADRLQDNVNATKARLQPRIDAVKAAHRGEEQARRILELYRQEGVHPLYTLKSLLGFLILLPVFIAVFDMLAEDFDIYRASFLWIEDLSRPDELLPLPVRLPFFGRHLNLLPFLMSGIAVAASLRFDSPILTPPLVRRQRRNLVGMALLFFLLFYTFPAGMVLYWTSTNALQLASRELGRLRRRRPSARPPAQSSPERTR